VELRESYPDFHYARSHRLTRTDMKAPSIYRTWRKQDTAIKREFEFPPTSTSYNNKHEIKNNSLCTASIPDETSYRRRAHQRRWWRNDSSKPQNTWRLQVKEINLSSLQYWEVAENFLNERRTQRFGCDKWWTGSSCGRRADSPTRQRRGG
jgi:hypothetical protein